VSRAEGKLFAGSIVMRVDAITEEVLQALHASGVEPILLKGPAIAQWLYEEFDRIYLDTDLLVAPQDLATAERTLRDLGFAAGQHGWLSKSRDWQRGPGAVDLHTSLYGIEADDATAWTLLSADPQPIEVGGITAHALSLDARAFHLATHAAQHEHSFSGPEEDLTRALAIVSPETWTRAAALADQLEATGTFAAGLRRVGANDVLQELGLADVPTPAAAALLSHKPPPTALGISQLAAAPTMRARASVLARAIVPRPQYMREHYSPARRPNAGLAAAYVLRLVDLGRQLPRGIRAWRRARRPPVD
jgi:hypothetical protein